MVSRIKKNKPQHLLNWGEAWMATLATKLQPRAQQRQSWPACRWFNKMVTHIVSCMCMIHSIAKCVLSSSSFSLTILCMRLAINKHQVTWHSMWTRWPRSLTRSTNKRTASYSKHQLWWSRCTNMKTMRCGGKNCEDVHTKESRVSWLKKWIVPMKG